MQFPADELEEFIRRWENAFGERLTAAAAEREASQLVELFRVLARPLPPDAKRRAGRDQPPAASPN